MKVKWYSIKWLNTKGWADHSRKIHGFRPKKFRSMCRRWIRWKSMKLIKQPKLKDQCRGCLRAIQAEGGSNGNEDKSRTN